MRYDPTGQPHPEMGDEVTAEGLEHIANCPECNRDRFPQVDLTPHIATAAETVKALMKQGDFPCCCACHMDRNDQGDTMSPVRIQRKRVKGWRMPEGAVYVGRGSRWGNPYKIGDRLWTPTGLTASASRDDVLEAFKDDIYWGACDFPDETEVRSELAGKDLACWCPLDKPCHADVLLELANKETP